MLTGKQRIWMQFLIQFVLCSSIQW